MTTMTEHRANIAARIEQDEWTSLTDAMRADGHGRIAAAVDTGTYADGTSRTFTLLAATRAGHVVAIADCRYSTPANTIRRYLETI